MQKKKIFFLILIVLGSIIGLFDVGYLSMLEWQGKNSSACDLGGLNCNAVLTSQYSKLFNIPLAYWGLAYYLVLFILIVVYLDFSAIGGKHQKIFQAIGLMLWVGRVFGFTLSAGFCFKSVLFVLLDFRNRYRYHDYRLSRGQTLF